MNIYPVSNWTSTEHLAQLWAKLVDGTRVRFVCDPAEAHLVLVVNRPDRPCPDALRGVPVLCVGMEPHMSMRPEIWGAWAASVEGRTVDGWAVTRQIRPPRDLNFVEWHLRHSAAELRAQPQPKTMPANRISVVLSNKHYDPGHILRVAVVKHLQRHCSARVKVDVYGASNTFGCERFCGNACIPMHDKTAALQPYRYHLAFENNAILNYVTEKLYDGVLMDTHCFYWGAPNASTVFRQKAPGSLDATVPAAFTQLPCTDDVAYLAELVVRHVAAGAWERGVVARAAMRTQVLDELACTPRVLQQIK